MKKSRLSFSESRDFIFCSTHGDKIRRNQCTESTAAEQACKESARLRHSSVQVRSVCKARGEISSVTPRCRHGTASMRGVRGNLPHKRECEIPFVRAVRTPKISSSRAAAFADTAGMSRAYIRTLSGTEHPPFGDAVRVLPGESPIGECPQSAVRKSGRCANQSRRSASALRYISSASPAIRETE